MNNTVTVILALLGMSAVDLFLVKQQPPAEPSAYGSDAITTFADLQPAMKYLAGSAQVDRIFQQGQARPRITHVDPHPVRPVKIDKVSAATR